MESFSGVLFGVRVEVKCEKNKKEKKQYMKNGEKIEGAITLFSFSVSL